jgi:hypothetical protein
MDGRGGLHTLQGIYPFFVACSGLLKMMRFDGFIFRAQTQLG